MPPPKDSKPEIPQAGSSINVIPFVHPQDSKGHNLAKQRTRLHLARLQLQNSRHSSYSSRYMQILDPTLDVPDDQPVLNQIQETQLTGKYQDFSVRKRADEGQPDGNIEEYTVNERIPSPRLIGSAQEDPFWTYPIPYSSSSSQMISYYMQHLALPIVDLDGPQNHGLLKSHWFPLAVTCSATLYSIILMTTAYYHFETGIVLRLPKKCEEEVLRLKACALEEINRIFSSSEMALCVSDAMIGSVAKLAGFEAVFGDVEVFQQHMAGLKKMIEIRESLEPDVNPLDPFVSRLVLWIDLNGSHFTRTPRTLVDMDLNAHEADFKGPNPVAFAGAARTLEVFGSKGGIVAEVPS